jgi:hypothetical protein
MKIKTIKKTLYLGFLSEQVEFFRKISKLIKHN